MTKRIAANIPASPYLRYDSPLRITGDALVLFDLHVPYHNAEFVSKVLELAAMWGIENLVLGGDWSDSHTLSTWGAEFKSSAKFNAESILDLMRTSELNEAERAKFLNLIEQAGLVCPDDLPSEMAIMRDVLRKISAQFRHVYAVIGNHDDRLMRKIDRDMTATDLVTYLMGGMPKNWHVEPFYYCEVYSGGERFLIEHPRGASVTEAAGLAAKFNAHVIVGHSHLWQVGRDVSGQYWAIAAGHCADEGRMAYAATRHSRRQAHINGAVILRDGYPWALTPFMDLARLKKCK